MHALRASILKKITVFHGYLICSSHDGFHQFLQSVGLDDAHLMLQVITEDIFSVGIGPDQTVN
jgi:hypothetical protein